MIGLTRKSRYNQFIKSNERTREVFNHEKEISTCAYSCPGGGKPDSAMGGGSDLLKLDDALATVDDFVAEKLK